MSQQTSNQFNGVTKAFHWSMAALMIALLVMGLIMEEMSRGPLKLEVMGWHKTLGMTVLGLVLLRVLWRFLSVRPGPLPTHSTLERWLARIVQTILYATMFLMPISGYVMSSAAGYGFKVWGWQVPMLIAADKGIMESAKEAHEIISNILIGALALHVLGALKHHFIDRDVTLFRMLPAMFGGRRL